MLTYGDERYEFAVDRFLEAQKPLKEAKNGNRRVAIVKGPFRPTFKDVKAFGLHAEDIGALYFHKYGVLVVSPTKVFAHCVGDNKGLAEDLFTKQAKDLGL